MKSKKTRERILDASLELFNRKKASNVSTVQISAEMKISPGNLYYYYANKEDVIRCIWEEHMKGELEALIKQTEKIETASELLDFIEAGMNHMINYRFFYTELSTLFINDEGLVEMCRDTERKLKNAFSVLGSRLVGAGYLAKNQDAARAVGVQNGIAAATHMLQRYDVYKNGGMTDAEFIGHSQVRVIAVLEAFFEEKMKLEAEGELKKRGFNKEKYLKI